MKKIFSLLLVLAMVFSLATLSGCNNNASNAKVKKGLKTIKLVYKDGSDTKDEYAITVKKGNQSLLNEINKVLKELKDNGTIDKSIIKHTNNSTSNKNKDTENKGTAKETPEVKGSSVATISPATDTALKDIKAKGELIMYTNAAFPPFEYLNGEEVVGVDVDIAKEIAKSIGVKLTIKNVEFDTILASIESGKGDIGAAGISITDERKQQVDFSDKYVTSMQYIILAEDSDIKTIEDLKGKRIGVQSGTTGDLIISEETEKDGVLVDSKTKVMPYNNAIDASMALKSGKIDAVVIDELPAKNICDAAA